MTLEERKRIAWARTKPLNGLLAAAFPSDARVDEAGRIICWSHYGRHDSPNGWEIDHHLPKALGGSDHWSNLRALSCSVNRGLGGLVGNALRG